MTETRRPLICMAPVKNEAWILDSFVRNASRWADHVIVADQSSDDGSADIVRRHPRAHLVENHGQEYDEATRKRVLLDAARAIAEGAILLALDADEMLAPGWEDSPEWEALQAAPVGTVIRVEHANIRPDRRSYWRTGDFFEFGFVDDGVSQPPEGRIHLPRVPVPASHPEMVLHDIKVLHFQYLDVGRYRTKQRWYRCWEHLAYPEKRPIQIFRQYHPVESIKPSTVFPLRPEWAEAVNSIESHGPYRFDPEVLAMFAEHGIRHFARMDVWDGVDWNSLASLHGVKAPTIADPRTRSERVVHQWLRRTQPLAARTDIRWVQRGLRLLGW